MSVARATYRTLCVRSCDGFYFPISFSTTRDRFGNDQMACEAMCPGTETDLYYHDAKLSVAPEGDAAVAMMSVKEEPYTALPAAFSYRARLDESCTCGRPEGQQFAAMRKVTEVEDAMASLNGRFGFVPLPVPRPDPSGDPEMLANQEGTFAAPISSQEALVSVAEGPSERPVRVILPAYGTDSGEALALLRPVSE